MQRNLKVSLAVGAALYFMSRDVSQAAIAALVTYAANSIL